MNRHAYLRIASKLLALASASLFLGCAQPSTGGGSGGGGSSGQGTGGSQSTGAGGQSTGAGGHTTGAGGSNPTTGAGGSNPTTGAGGSSTTGLGGSNPTGAGGTSTTGAGGHTTGAGGASSTGKGGTTGNVDAGTDAIVCSNMADMSLLPIDVGGFINEVCNTYGIQGAWYCYSDTTPTAPGMAVSGNGTSDCVNAVPPYIAASGGMCISGTTSTNAGGYGAAIGLELNTIGAINGVNQPKMAYNATSHNVVGFEITITSYKGANNNVALRLTFTTAATTAVTQPFVDLPGPGTYDVLFADAVVPGSFSDSSANLRVTPSAVYDIQLAVPKEANQATYGYCITKIKPITAAAAAPGSCSALQNYGTPVCGAQDLMGEVGNYGVQNNVSGSGQECIQAKVGGSTCAGFSLTYPTNTLNGSTFPAAYPSIVYGWQAGSFYGAYKTAKQLSAVASAPSSWTFTPPSSAGQWDASYDIWLHPTNAAPKTANGGLELMIWLGYGGGVNPAGSLAAGKSGITVGTAPGSWDLYKGTVSVNGSTWNYLAYRRTAQISAVTGLDLKQFFNDAVTEGVGITNTSYLLGIQAGFEVTGANAGSTSSFSVTTN